MQRAWPGLLAVCVGGVAAWAAFLSYAANQERVSSSAMRRVLSELRDSEDVRAILGDAVRPEPMWYLSGSPWVHGTVRLRAFRILPIRRSEWAGQAIDYSDPRACQVKMLQGNIDISFRVKGHKGTLARNLCSPLSCFADLT